MSLASAVWHVVPWWIPVALIAVAVLITMLGLWPIAFALLKRAWPLIRALWPVWLVIAIAVGVAVWLDYHDQLLTKSVTDKVTKERDTYWEDREDKANKAFEARIGAMNRRLEVAGAAADAAAARTAVEIAQARRDRDAARTQLDEMRSRNVTAEANRLCTLTRGVIVQFNAGAAGANGKPPGDAEASAGAGPESRDAPSGISVDTYSRAVEDTQHALGECRGQVIGWQKYHRDVVAPWVASVIEALSTFPKGVP